MEFLDTERVVLLFVDGLGVGADDPDRNPMARVRGKYLNVFSPGTNDVLPFQGIVKPLDASLGLEGIPQSATGQTALLTGVNAARVLRRHLFGFPNQKLQEIIMEHSLLKRVTEAGRRAAFINVFRPPFFDLGEEIWNKVALSVTTWVNRAARLPFFDLDDLRAERAIYQEFTNRDLRERGLDVPLFGPEKAGRILASRSRDFDLLLYEYFRTDAAGHSQDMEKCMEEVRRLEAFLDAFMHDVDLESTLVILTSDHGNIEDLSVRTHTRNPAMTLLWGAGAEAAAEYLESIADMPGVILKALGIIEG